MFAKEIWNGAVMSANPDAERFARLVLQRFDDLGLTTDEEVKAAGGPSTSTMTKLRAASAGKAMTEPRGDTRRNIDAAAQWAPGSALTVWRGGEPTPRQDATVRAPAASVGPSSEDADTLLFKRPEGLSDEAWERLQAEHKDYWQWLLDRASRER